MKAANATKMAAVTMITAVQATTFPIETLALMSEDAIGPVEAPCR